MAQAKKKYMRRKVAQIVKYQLQSISNLLELRELFNEFHPEWDELFTAIANNCSMTVGLIKGVATRAWGYFPDSFEKWLS